MKEQFLAMIDEKIEENLYEEVHTIDVLRKFRSEVEKMRESPIVISGGFQPDNWISCLEKLPKEDHVYVLGANSKTNFVGEMNWESDYGFSHHMMPGQTITHWQYLPPPPIK